MFDYTVSDMLQVNLSSYMNQEQYLSLVQVMTLVESQNIFKIWKIS